MNKKRSKKVLVVIGIFALVVLGSLLIRDLPRVSAENHADPWASSEDPPDGIGIDALSPPDQPKNDNLQSDQEPGSRAVLKSHRIAGSVLRPRRSVVDFAVGSSGGCIYAENNTFDVFNTPIWLPPGATVDTLRMYYYDTSASNSAAWFTIYDLYGEIVNEWPVSSSGSLGNSFNDSAQISHTIDYDLFSYSLNWRPNVAGDSMQLCGFRIFYEPPPLFAQFLPSVSN